jgi:hypothetical protein
MCFLLLPLLLCLAPAVTFVRFIFAATYSFVDCCDTTAVAVDVAVAVAVDPTHRSIRCSYAIVVVSLAAAPMFCAFFDEELRRSVAIVVATMCASEVFLRPAKYPNPAQSIENVMQYVKTLGVAKLDLGIKLQGQISTAMDMVKKKDKDKDKKDKFKKKSGDTSDDEKDKKTKKTKKSK